MSEEYEDMTVSELKALLKEKGLKVGGNKSELIARLSESDGSTEEVVEESVEEEVEDDSDDKDYDSFDDDDWDDDD